MPNPNEVSHGDILFQIGELKGQLGALIIVVNQKREDLNGAFTRLGALEKSAVERRHLAEVEGRVGTLERALARWGGVVLICSGMISILVTTAKPMLHFGVPPQSTTERISQ